MEKGDAEARSHHSESRRKPTVRLARTRHLPSVLREFPSGRFEKRAAFEQGFGRSVVPVAHAVVVSATVRIPVGRIYIFLRLDLVASLAGSEYPLPLLLAHHGDVGYISLHKLVARRRGDDDIS